MASEDCEDFMCSVINCDCSDEIGLVEDKSGKSAMMYVRERWTVLAMRQGTGK
jgi:hypothetical protein